MFEPGYVLIGSSICIYVYFSTYSWIHAELLKLINIWHWFVDTYTSEKYLIFALGGKKLISSLALNPSKSVQIFFLSFVSIGSDFQLFG
jgi:hypothetical protein